MSALLIAVLVFFAYLIAYRTYGTFLSQKVFGLDPDRVTPAHRYRDDKDFVPSNKWVLFGHHFTTIAGAGPIVGPAIAVIWGWVPALMWVVFGTIFMGAIHDFGSLVLSARHEGKSVSAVTEELIGPRARTLFLLLTAFALLIVLAVFAVIIALLFTMFPGSVLPIFIEIPVAIAIGYWIYKKSGNHVVAGTIAVITLYVFVVIGTYVPLTMPGIIMGNPIYTWVVILLVYSFIASTLPVWMLLQPRDYINSHQLFIVLIMMVLGVIVARPEIVAPAFHFNAVGAPPFFPFLFVVIACGAISGFHSMAASGTTVKQMDNESDAKLIGYGAMLTEGFLATMVILACTAGFSSLAAWTEHYASWQAADGLGAKVGAFVNGGGSFISALGIPQQIALTIMAVMVVSFAATTMDSATRIQRYIIAELAESYGIKPLATPTGAALFAVITAFALASINGGRGGMILWPLFGASNQLMAGLALLVMTVWLIRIKKPSIYSAIPMVFMIFITTWAMIAGLVNYYNQGNWLLTILSFFIILLEVWVVIEAITILKNPNKLPYQPHEAIHRDSWAGYTRE
ncbi:MAG: carbon starvation protein A [Clostridiales bacterium]|nr:carbon starvation protein A [Clostridiales bacterium]